jgi:aminoglycoside phosphotransferase family enzyme/predicted kinase
MLPAIPDPLPAGLVEELSFPEDPDASEGVLALQTHISHVFLTRRHVYKFRKAVAFPFLSFATRDERNADSQREIELNRRLAPGVYLGLAPARRVHGRWEVGPVREGLAPASKAGRRPEHCVVMRRLPDGGDALSLLETGRLTPRRIDAVARCVAHFHTSHRLGRPAPFTPEEWLAVSERPALENLRILRETDPESPLARRAARVESATRALIGAKRDVFEERRRSGLAVDGHGDLHLPHVWFEDGDDDPLVVDCTEFNEAFRRIDAASDVAFFAMDLRYRGRDDLAEGFLASYAQECDDYDLYRLVDFYESYRATVRSKVAMLASRDREIGHEQRAGAAGSAEAHLALAEACLVEGPPGAVILTCGVVGSGKSTVAAALAEQTAGVIASSDRTRKQMAGLAPTERSARGGEPLAGIYGDDTSDRVYAGLAERALPVVLSGRTAILDASFARSKWRRQLREWAEHRGLKTLLVEVRCGAEVAAQRLARRVREDRDPSDAGPSLHRWSALHFEPTDDWPADWRIAVDSDAPDWRATLFAEPHIAEIE